MERPENKIRVKDSPRHAWILWVISGERVLQGLFLLMAPGDWWGVMGFTVDAYRFFTALAGCSSLILGIAAGSAARSPDRYPGLVYLTMLTEIFFFLFLAIYFLLIEKVWAIAVMGVLEGLLAMAVLAVAEPRGARGD